MKRRDFLKSAGGLVIAFSIPLQTFGQQQPRPDPRFLTAGAWLEIAPDGAVTFYTGKVELGTGVETALAQLVAEELDVELGKITMVMGDTERCPDQMGTFGSFTIALAGPQVRQAAAEARLALLELAAARLGPQGLKTENGAVIAPDGRRIGYGELVEGKRLQRPLSNNAKLKDPAEFKVIGKSAPRMSLPAKVYGTHAYIHNVRLPGMIHGRVIRPPVHGTSPVLVDDSALKKLPGNPRVVRKGNFLAVVADREERVIRAAQALKVEWGAALVWPQQQELPQLLKTSSTADRVLESAGEVEKALAQAAKTHRAQYFVPYQLHGSIGPSCALADVKADRATLWSPTQTSFNTRDSVAAILGMPSSRVHLIWLEGSGCYGQNGADDVTADAALLSQLIGQPVRVQWMRYDENRSEPKGPPMAMEVKGGLDAAGNIVAWDYQVWSVNHGGRPAFAQGGNLLAGEEQGMSKRFAQVGADINAKPSYMLPNKRAVLHELHSTPLRTSSLRGLGSPANTFANESFIDELAHLAGADPLEYRIRHLKDERAIAVLREVAKLSSWQAKTAPAKSGLGKGVAFVHYHNNGTYVAVAVQVRVDADSRTRVQKVWVAHDCGLIVNPDGVKQQIEGNVIQTLSRALIEEVRFNRLGIESLDWASYPIMRFSEVPDEIAISLINRPTMRATGVGEPAASPVFAAVANAIYDATGVRPRDVPFTPERLKAQRAA